MAEASLEPFVFPTKDHELTPKKILEKIPEYNEKTEAKREEIKLILGDN